MKHPTKKGGGTLREYRAFGYRVTLETFSERTAKRWQVTAFDEDVELRLAEEAIHAGLKRIAQDLTAPKSNGGAPAPTGN